MPVELEPLQNDVLSRALGGDMAAFCLVVSHFESRILGQALALCGDLPTAEDLAQQTWLEAWKSRSRYNHSCRFTTWLYSILLHVHYHVLRKKRSSPIPLTSLAADQSDRSWEQWLATPSAADSPSEALVNKELASQWRQLAEGLPEIHREVIMLRFFEHAALDEIAAVTGVSVNTVKTRLHYALKKMRLMEDKMNFLSSRRQS